MIFVIVGSSRAKQPFKTAGRGSNSQDLDSDFLVNFFYFLLGNLSKVAKLCTARPETQRLLRATKKVAAMTAPCVWTNQIR